MTEQGLTPLGEKILKGLDDLEAEAEKLKAKHNWSDDQLANHYARTEEGVISWDFPIGVVVGGDLVSMPLRDAVVKHPGNYCLHPFEPEYGGTDKSKICKH